jgi:hypothetical protein
MFYGLGLVLLVHSAFGVPCSFCFPGFIDVAHYQRKTRLQRDVLGEGEGEGAESSGGAQGKGKGKGRPKKEDVSEMVRKFEFERKQTPKKQNSEERNNRVGVKNGESARKNASIKIG